MTTYRLPKKQAIIAWIIQGLLAAAFLAAGISKLIGAASMVAVFDQIGFGQWFRYVTGSVELVGVIALLTPGFATLGALWLAFTMLCATITHITILHSNPAAAVVLLLLNGVVVWLRSGELAVLRAKYL